MKNSFLILTSALLIVLGIALCTIPTGELHLLLNGYHAAWLDIICKHFTIVGEWIPYIIVVGLLLYRYTDAAFLLTNILASGLICRIFKLLCNAPRPVKWFAENMPDVQLPLVDGVKMASFYSFPSGHTTTFFALFFSLCIIISQHKKWGNRLASIAISTILFLLAGFGAYTRIYLSQHFALDIFGGIGIGIAIPLFLLPLYTNLSTIYDFGLVKNRPQKSR